MTVAPVIELTGLDLTLRPLSNRLLDLAHDFEQLAEHERRAPSPRIRLVSALRRDAAQLRAVRELLHSAGIEPRFAADWARAATRHLQTIRERRA